MSLASRLTPNMAAPKMGGITPGPRPPRGPLGGPPPPREPRRSSNRRESFSGERWLSETTPELWPEDEEGPAFGSG